MTSLEFAYLDFQSDINDDNTNVKLQKHTQISFKLQISSHLDKILFYIEKFSSYIKKVLSHIKKVLSHMRKISFCLNLFLFSLFTNNFSKNLALRTFEKNNYFNSLISIYQSITLKNITYITNFFIKFLHFSARFEIKFSDFSTLNISQFS